MKSERSSGRRRFLKSAGLASAAALGLPTISGAQPQGQSGPSSRAVPPPINTAAETVIPPAPVEVAESGRYGADIMVDVIKTLGIEYIAVNPANTYRALHESLVNYGGNQTPEVLTALHEEQAVSMAQGYYKIEGKPMAIACHGTVGLMHASMALYNAYSDRVPVFVFLGAPFNPAQSVLSAQNPAALTRDFTKWNDGPRNFGAFGESVVRAYKIAMTVPRGPVVIAVDQDLQEREVARDAKFVIPKMTTPIPPSADAATVKEIARLLVAAEMPVIVAGKMLTGASMPLLIELAEALQAPVISRDALRTNFPNRHYLNQDANDVSSGADVLLGLDTIGLPRGGPRVRTISITASDLDIPDNYHSAGRYAATDISVAADGEASLPALIEAVKRTITPDRQRVFEDRRKKFMEMKANEMDRARLDASFAWEASPISNGRLTAEIWDVIKNEDWSLVGGAISTSIPGWGSGFERQFWNFDKPYRSVGWLGGGGLGNGPGTSVGAALANKKHGRFSISMQNDGDFMYAPGVLWTAAHHKIPLLIVMRNNRCYHQELMQVQMMCNRMNRGVDKAHIGNDITNPNIDYAKLAQGLGVYAEGPIENPKDLGPALRRAAAIVKRGEPALIDAVIQPR
jgi:acetolactate synthase I/II/III large subunit